MTLKDVAEELHVASGTVKRWIQNEDIPSLYCKGT